MSEWLTSKEASEYLKVSIGTLQNICCLNQVKYYKLGRRSRFKKSDLDKILKVKK